MQLGKVHSIKKMIFALIFCLSKEPKQKLLRNIIHFRILKRAHVFFYKNSCMTIRNTILFHKPPAALVYQEEFHPASVRLCLHANLLQMFGKPRRDFCELSVLTAFRMTLGNKKPSDSMIYDGSILVISFFYKGCNSHV